MPLLPAPLALHPLPARSPRAARHRRALQCASLLLLAVPLAGCSEPNPPKIVHLLELAANPSTGKYTASAPSTAPALHDGSELEWTALPSPEREVGPEELATFQEFAKASESGELSLGASPGAWATVIPIEPNTDFKITAQARLEGLLPGPGYRTARILIVDFSAKPESLELESMLEVELNRTWGASLEGDQVTRNAELIFRTHPEAHSLGVFLFLTMNKNFEEARVTWSNVKLMTALPADHLRAANEEPVRTGDASELSVGGFIIGETYRPAFGLLDGDQAEIEVTLPEGDSTLDLWIGVPPYELTPEGASASLEISVVQPGKVVPFQIQGEVENVAGSPTRWRSVRAKLPEVLAGEPIKLRFTAQCSPGPVVLAVANPRIVPGEPERVGPNVLLISLDTLRADRLGAYGGPEINSPNIDALAAESLLFENAWSPAPYTLPSHVSIFSGQLPSVHGVQRPGNRIETARTTLIANYLGERGYTTGAFTGGGYVHPNFGFASGFESYGTIDPVSNLDSLVIHDVAATNPLRSLELIGDSDIECVVTWLEEHAGESFLLFFHSYIAHQFDPSPEAAELLGVKHRLPEDQPILHLLFTHANPNEEQRARLLELYDASIRQADTAIGRLMEALRELELLEDTIIVLTSDHGKELGEHGTINHGHSLHRELVNVPLFVRIPGNAPERRTDPASGVDIFPTILELLDLPLPNLTPLQGVSLISPPSERPVFAEVDSIHSGVALREGDLKTIVMISDHDWEAGGVEKSFDVVRDPLELSPLESSEERRVRALEFARALRALGASLGGTDGERRPLDPETKAQLEGLGYTIGAED